MRRDIAISCIKSYIAQVRGHMDVIEHEYRDPDQFGTVHAALRDVTHALLNIDESLAIMRVVEPLLPKAAGGKEAGDAAD
jgi:hypothetical protein